MKWWFFWTLSVMSVFGEDFTIQVDGVEDDVLVSLPEGHDSSKSWPSVFFYHGTNGRPSTTLMRAHTGEKDWIVVGMAYARRGTFQLTPVGMDEEVRVLKAVRAELQRRAGLDPARVYLAGQSKGGWVCGLLLQKERSLAGAAILLAGHMHALESVPKPLAKDTPVFIGVGRLDANYPFALKGLVFFRKLGAKVDMETWRGVGHSFPDWGSTGLKEWLALRLGREPDLDGLEEELGVIAKMENDFEKWWSLVEFSERPFVAESVAISLKGDTLREEMEKDPQIEREARILKESRRLLAKEIGKKTLQDLEEVVAGHARIAEKATDSPQGKVAAKDYERVGKILDYAREQSRGTQLRGAEVKPETEKRRIPMNPLVR
ncbi:MAG: hypothetical protein ACSHYB_06930 [Roseibacillus sp.]